MHDMSTINGTLGDLAGLEMSHFGTGRVDIKNNNISLDNTHKKISLAQQWNSQD